eukprot:TRINITY_DN9501_c0_g1_i1.p1 TRINITY_DN9501_c0_g1~~TRINITY_DN9501_c0_g1_i1.p1  ORF type:complete len:317 (+),score=17.19 TRINITY_DN9501_c0_g1_i1:67-1017(+)
MCIRDRYTDVLPTYALCQEKADIDLMNRNPMSKSNCLATNQIFVFAYTQYGIIEALACLLTYFTIMSDFGWDFWDLFFLAIKTGVHPKPSDTYDATLPNYGNTNILCDRNHIRAREGKVEVPDWLSMTDSKVDLRMYYLTCENGIIKQAIHTKNCLVPQISSVTRIPVCFTTESLKYAQSGYFYTIILMQVTNAIQVRTLFSSLKSRVLVSLEMMHAIYFNICLILMFAYCFPINLVFDTRDTIWFHTGILGLPFSILMMIVGQIHKNITKVVPSQSQQQNRQLNNQIELENTERSSERINYHELVQLDVSSELNQ